MKERRKNVQKFTLLSDDLSMEASVDSKLSGISATSGDEGFEDLPIDGNKKDDNSVTDLSKTATPQVKVQQKTCTRQLPLKNRSKEKQNQEAVIIPRRRKSRQLPSRTSNRGVTNVLMTVELNPEFHKPGSRSQKRNLVSTKDRVLNSTEGKEPLEEATGEFKAAALNHIDANRDRLFGGEPEPKERPRLRTSRRRRRPKPGDNSEQHVCWWVAGYEDDVPPVKVPQRPSTSAGTSTAVQDLLTGKEPTGKLTPTLSQRRRNSLFKQRESDTATKLFGTPEPRKPSGRIRPGDASYSRLFGPEAHLPPRPCTVAVASGVNAKNTQDRLFGETNGESPRPLSKHFPGKPTHENIFPVGSLKGGMIKGSQSARHAANRRNPIIGEVSQFTRVRQDSGSVNSASSNPITGEGYRPCKRDIHAVTCRI